MHVWIWSSVRPVFAPKSVRPPPIFTQSPRKVVVGGRGRGLGLDSVAMAAWEVRRRCRWRWSSPGKESGGVGGGVGGAQGPLWSLPGCRRVAQRWWRDGGSLASREGEGEEGKQREREVARAGGVAWRGVEEALRAITKIPLPFCCFGLS